jgi:transcriptional regulator with XRE-family HTH domain
MTLAALGRRIRQLREARGLSQAALAKKARISRITLLRVENATQDLTTEKLERIARALGVRVRDLFPE